MASSSNDRFSTFVALGVLSKGRAADSVGAVVERLEAIRQTGRLTDRENGKLVDLVVAAVSEAYRFSQIGQMGAGTDSEGTTRPTRTPVSPFEAQYGSAVRSVQDIRRKPMIDLVRCKECKEPLYGIDGHTWYMACQNIDCVDIGKVVRTRNPLR